MKCKNIHLAWIHQQEKMSKNTFANSRVFEAVKFDDLDTYIGNDTKDMYEWITETCM